MRWIKSLIVLTILALSLASAYFIAENAGIEKSISAIHKNSPENLSLRLKAERDLLKKYMDEKYKTGLLPFEKVFKSIEAERKKIKEMEGKILEIKK